MAFSSPVLSEKTFENFGYNVNNPSDHCYDGVEYGSDNSVGLDESALNNVAMTLAGTTNKALILMSMLTASAVGGWITFITSPNPAVGLMMISAIIALIMAIVLAFKPHLAPMLAPIYAILEGYAIGVTSLVISDGNRLLVFHAVCTTFGVAFAMFGLYRSRIVTVTERFKSVVMGAGMGICLLYFVSLMMSFFGASIPYLHDAGPLGFGINVVIACVAAFFLMIDFDNIERGVEYKAPKFMEWYCAFSLMVTLVWLYLEILKLFTRRRN